MQSSSPEEAVGAILIIVPIMVFALILVFMAVRSNIEADRQKTEQERIRHAPKYRREGRLLIRRENPDGSYHDLSLDTISLGRADPGIKRFPDGNRHKQLRWQPRNHNRTGKEVVIYRRHYPSKPGKFYREEDE